MWTSKTVISGSTLQRSSNTSRLLDNQSLIIRCKTCVFSCRCKKVWAYLHYHLWTRHEWHKWSRLMALAGNHYLNCCGKHDCSNIIVLSYSQVWVCEPIFIFDNKPRFLLINKFHMKHCKNTPSITNNNNIIYQRQWTTWQVKAEQYMTHIFQVRQPAPGTHHRSRDRLKS